MCRIAMFDKKGTELVEEQIGVKRFLDHLEKQCGGHGNGLVLIKNNKISYINKGVKFSNKAIAHKLLNLDYDYAMYHTRVASVSSVSDSNCHPFWTYKRDFALMMNGTEREIGALAEPLGITDTELVFRMIRDYNIPLKTLEDMTARYMGFKDGKVFYVNTTYGGLELLENKEGFCVASSFPSHIKSESLASGLWVQGQKMKRKSYSYGKVSDYTAWGKHSYSNYTPHVTKNNSTFKSDKNKAVEECRVSSANDFLYTPEEIEALVEAGYLDYEDAYSSSIDKIFKVNEGYLKDKEKGKLG